MRPRDSLRNLPLHSIFEDSINGFGNELELFMNPRVKTPTFMLKLQDDLKTVKDQMESVRPPFFTYRMINSDEPQDGINVERRFRFPAYYGGPKSDLNEQGEPRDPNKAYVALHLFPIDLQIEVEYHCSFKEQIRFAQLWHIRALKRVRLMEIDIAENEAPIRISADFESGVTYSDIDFDGDSLVSCQGTLTMHTYMGVIDTVKPLSQVTVRERMLYPDKRDNYEIEDRGFEEQTLIVGAMGVKRETSR